MEIELKTLFTRYLKYKNNLFFLALYLKFEMKTKFIIIFSILLS